MAKFEESDLLELFGVFDRNYCDRMIAGSPQRFIRKWSTRIKQAQEIGVLDISVPAWASSDHTRVLIFAEAMTRHRFNRIEEKDGNHVFQVSLDRIGRLNALGSHAASGKFNLLQDLLIRRRVKVIEALIAASSWLDSRAEALESRRAFEENEKRKAEITRINQKLEATRFQLKMLKVIEEELESSVTKLDEEINEYNRKYSQEEIADQNEHSREKNGDDRRRASEGIETS